MPTDVSLPNDKEVSSVKDDCAPDDDDIRRQCKDVLTAAGVTSELCQFFADILQCERGMFRIIHRIRGELREVLQKSSSSQDVSTLVAVAQKTTKCFESWRKQINELSNLSRSLPPVKIDSSKFDENFITKAKCWLQTKSLKISSGDEITITDITRPNKLKVRAVDGNEGYVPALCCILPSPDRDAMNAIKRLQIHLLICWSYCDKEMEMTSRHVIMALTSSLHDLTPSIKKRNNRQVRLIDEFVGQMETKLEESENWLTLAQLVSSLIQELRSHQTSELASVINVLVDIEKIFLSHQDFHEKWWQCKTDMANFSSGPINIELCRDLQLIRCRSRRQKYYEVKITTEETVTEEETTTMKVRNDGGRGDNVRAGQSSQSVDAEQLTSKSQEESTRFVIKGVIDSCTGCEISFDEAIKAGIMDPKRGLYIDKKTGHSCPIPEAMGDGRIIVERVSTTKSAEKTHSAGLITIRTQTDTREFTVVSAFDKSTSETVDAQEARRRGIIDESKGIYTDTGSGLEVPLNDAIEQGFVTVEYDEQNGDNGHDDETVKTYAVSAIVDQVARKPVPFSDAVSLGLIDRESGCYVNNATGERVFAAEAIRRGLFKAVLVTDPSSLSDIDVSNRVVVERIDRVRKSMMQGVKALSAFRRMTSKD